MKSDRIKIIRRIRELVGIYLPREIDFDVWPGDRTGPLAILKCVFVRNDRPNMHEPEGCYRWRASRTIDVSDAQGSFARFAESIDEETETAIAAMVESVIDELHNAEKETTENGSSDTAD